MFRTTHRPGVRFAPLFHATLTCVALFTFASCNSSSGGGSSAFTVAETTPADGATSVSPDATITVRFSADLAGQTVTTESFAVQTMDGTPIAGDYFLDARSVMFRPDAALPEEEPITVSLSEAIESVTGIPLRSMTFRFTVGTSTPPVEPPEDPGLVTVLATQPAPFAQSVDPAAVIEIEFSAPIAASSVNDGTVWVSGTFGGRYPVTVQMAAPTATSVRILATRDWLPGEVISVNLLGAVTPADPETSFPGYSYSFRVGSTAGTAERVAGDHWIAPGAVRDFRLGNLDGDEHLDVVYFVEGGSTVEALRRLADGSFSFPSRINVGQLVTSLELADLDGDGDSDLIVGSADRAYTYLSGFNGFSPAFSSGDSYVSRSVVHTITAADLDHAGHLDVVLGTSGGIQVFLADEGADPVHSIGGTQLSNTPVRCADLDLDGHLDLIYGTLGFNLITYHLGGALAGEFDAARSVILPTGAADLAVEDFTGDGRPDLLALLSSVDAGQSPIALLSQFGDLEFAGASLDIMPLLSQTDERMVLADLEGRGVPDLLWVDRSSDTISRLPADPGPTPPWSDRVEFHAGPADGAIQAADVDGDGRIDLAYATGSEIRFLVSSPIPPAAAAIGDRSQPVRRPASRCAGEMRNASGTIRLTHSAAIQGATILTGYDPLVVSTPSVDFAGTAFETVEFTTWELVADPPAIHVTALVDVELPIEGLSLPAADDRALFKVRFDVSRGCAARRVAARLRRPHRHSLPHDQLHRRGGDAPRRRPPRPARSSFRSLFPLRAMSRIRS